MTQEISIRLRFEFAHRLLHHKGKCNNIHGHSGIAWVYFTGDVNDQTGMMADFGDIKKTIQTWIDEHWDHALILNSDDADLLNAFITTPILLYQTVGDPTMENLCRILSQVIWTMKGDETLPASLILSRVTIQETENAFVNYSPVIIDGVGPGLGNVNTKEIASDVVGKELMQHLRDQWKGFGKVLDQLEEKHSGKTQEEWMSRSQDETNEQFSTKEGIAGIAGIEGRDSQ